MGTVSGLRTRRYHGLLVVAGDPIARRHLGVASLDPVLWWPSGARIRLGTHQWRSGVVDPAGHTYLERFDLIDGLPRWRWRVGAVVLERELAMAPGRPCLAARHRLLAGGPVTVALEVLCTWRDAHAEGTAAGPPPPVTSVMDGFEVAGAYRVAGPGFVPAGDWWYGATCEEEAARAHRDRGPVACGPLRGGFERPGDVIEVTAWADDLATTSPAAGAIIETARAHHRSVVAGATDPTVAALTLAADARGRRRHARGGRRLPMVRRLVTRHHDLLRGPLPHHRPRAGAASCTAPTRPPSARMLANTADGEPSTTPPTPRCGSCTRWTARHRHW